MGIDAQTHTGHDWMAERIWEELEGGWGFKQLAVLLSCRRCGSIAEFRGGAVPPCTPERVWTWTARGWEADDRDWEADDDSS